MCHVSANSASVAVTCVTSIRTLRNILSPPSIEPHCSVADPFHPNYYIPSMFIYVLMAWVALTVVHAHVLPQQLERSISGLIITPSSNAACDSIDSPCSGLGDPIPCICTNENMLLFGEQALCWGPD
ncbi:hypothetical protein K439DRAFT_489583 [Ramaria rubella]|nr:hypothetical protein K439DRAFT_489583 [Ramaria rubella]